MEKLFAGPFGLFLVIAQAAFFIYLMRGLFETVAEDGISRTLGVGRRRPRREAAGERRDRPEASWQGSRGWSRTSRTLETFEDLATGAISGRVVEGPFAGRRLEDLSRAELMRLFELCRGDDPEACEFLETYMRRRFADAGPRSQQRRQEYTPPPPRDDGQMTRERAYAILGLQSGASDDDIHQAYRGLIKKHHPDHGGSHAKAAEINQAKDLLLG